MKARFVRSVMSCSFLFLGLCKNTVALSQQQISTKEQGQQQQVVADKSSDSLPSDQKFVSDGTPIQIPSLKNVTITPPQGWEIITDSPALSLIMQETAKQDVVKDYSKPVFQRNITIATIHHASPIDKKRLKELEQEMTRTFGRDPLVKDFQIVEKKFFNYRDKDDGILVFSSLKLGEFAMMQMHILVAGAEKQFLLTYSDLAEAFNNKNNEHFNQAWNSIVSIEVPGKAPKRYQLYLPYMIAGGVALTIFFLFVLLRWRLNSKDYAKIADEAVYGSDSNLKYNDDKPITISMVWNLAGLSSQQALTNSNIMLEESKTNFKKSQNQKSKASEILASGISTI